MQLRKLATAIGSLLLTNGLAALSGTALANNDLVEMSQDDRNWVMQTKDYSSTHLLRPSVIESAGAQSSRGFSGSLEEPPLGHRETIHS